VKVKKEEGEKGVFWEVVFPGKMFVGVIVRL
jgi:hypothetical protein